MYPGQKWNDKSDLMVPTNWQIGFFDFSLASYPIKGLLQQRMNVLDPRMPYLLYVIRDLPLLLFLCLFCVIQVFLYIFFSSLYPSEQIRAKENKRAEANGSTCSLSWQCYLLPMSTWRGSSNLIRKMMYTCCYQMKKKNWWKTEGEYWESGS